MQISSATSRLQTRLTDNNDHSDDAKADDSSRDKLQSEPAEQAAKFSNIQEQQYQQFSSMDNTGPKVITEGNTSVKLDEGQSALVFGAENLELETHAVQGDPDAEIHILGTTNGSTITGSASSEQIFLSGDRNRIYSRSGDDQIWVGGADKLLVDAGEGNDRVRINGLLPSENLDDSRGSSVINVIGGDGDDHLTLINVQPDDSGETAANSIFEFGGRNIWGGSGNDVIEIINSEGITANGEDFDYHVVYQNSNDTFRVTNSKDIYLYGGLGDDTFHVDADSTDIFVYGGDLYELENNDVLFIDKPLDLNNYEARDLFAEWDAEVREFEISASGDPSDIIKVRGIECIEFNNGYRLLLREDGSGWDLADASVPKGEEQEPFSNGGS